MLKKTKIYLGIAAGITVATSAAGYWGGQYYIAKTFKETISNSGYCLKTSAPEYSIKNGSMLISADCFDFYGHQWNVFTMLKPDWNNKGIYSQTKLIANDEHTVNSASQLIDPKTKAIKATSYGLHTLAADHFEIEFEPFQLVSEQNSILMPTSVAIIDMERKSSKIDVVYAPTDDILIDTLGGETKITTPRVMWNITDKNNYKISVKSDSVLVGNMEISNKPIASVSQTKNNNTLDVSVEFKADSVTNNKDVKLDIDLNNLEPKSTMALFKSSTSLLQDNSPDAKAKLVSQSLENLFELAKNNASAKVKLKTDELNSVMNDVSLDVKFEDDAKNYISKNNAFSILESLIVDANLKLKQDSVLSLVDPYWLQNFVADGLIENRNGQLITDIQFRDMTATVNGKTINL